MDPPARHPAAAGDLYRHDRRPGRHDDRPVADVAGPASAWLLLHRPDVPPADGGAAPRARSADRVLPVAVAGGRAGRGLHRFDRAGAVRDGAGVSIGHGPGLPGPSVAGRPAGQARGLADDGGTGDRRFRAPAVRDAALQPAAAGGLQRLRADVDGADHPGRRGHLRLPDPRPGRDVHRRGRGHDHVGASYRPRL
ncbi:hypothetical protein D3C73_934160 [compost metagenome]